MDAVIKTERLLLRPLCLADLHTTNRYAGSLDNAQYMVHLPHRTLEDTRRFLRDTQAEWQKDRPEYYEFAVLFEDRHIGAVSIYLSDCCAVGELGWIIHRDYWGMGIATEAASAVAEFAAERLHVQKLIACCDSRNTGSLQVMKKIGMALESSDGIRYNKLSQEPSTELVCSMAVGHASEKRRAPKKPL